MCQLLANHFCCSYNPYDGPNEHPEAELPLVAGKYLYVYGTMDEDGFYEGLAHVLRQGLFAAVPCFMLSLSVSQVSCWMDSGDSSPPTLWISFKKRRRPPPNTGTR